MFPCTVCGECCKQVHMAGETKWLDRGDNQCRHFDGDTLRCEIYNDRPLICRIDDMYRLHFHTSMTKRDYYLLNAECCNVLQENAGIGREFRVVISDEI